MSKCDHMWASARLFANGYDVHIAEARAMVGSLLQEWERLYDKVGELEVLARDRHSARNVEAATVERSRIVRWLRAAGVAELPPQARPHAAIIVGALADAIMHGEHLK